MGEVWFEGFRSIRVESGRYKTGINGIGEAVLFRIDYYNAQEFESSLCPKVFMPTSIKEPYVFCSAAFRRISSSAKLCFLMYSTTTSSSALSFSRFS